LKEGIVDYFFHLKTDEYCVRKWERVGSDDEDMESWLIGGKTYHGELK